MQVILHTNKNLCENEIKNSATSATYIKKSLMVKGFFEVAVL